MVGNIIWGAAPTLQESADFVSKNNMGDLVDAYLYIGKGKVVVKARNKFRFSDKTGKIICLGKGFSLTSLKNLA